jgi:hypothetical protein
VNKLHVTRRQTCAAKKIEYGPENRRSELRKQLSKKQAALFLRGKLPSD